MLRNNLEYLEFHPQYRYSPLEWLGWREYAYILYSQYHYYIEEMYMIYDCINDKERDELLECHNDWLYFSEYCLEMAELESEYNISNPGETLEWFEFVNFINELYRNHAIDIYERDILIDDYASMRLTYKRKLDKWYISECDRISNKNFDPYHNLDGVEYGRHN